MKSIALEDTGVVEMRKYEEHCILVYRCSSNEEK